MNTLFIKRGFILLSLVFSFSISKAAIISAVADGNWGVSSTWDLRVPTDNDTIIIPSSTTVTKEKRVSLDSVQIEIYGTLLFKKGRKLILDAPSVIYIVNPGTVNGNDNNGNSIKIGGQTKWKGKDGTIVGDRAITTNSDPSNSPNFNTQIPPGALLPIELLDFEAVIQGENIKIKWTTILEINNDYFELLRSTDGQNWEIVLIKNGQTFSNTPIEYDYIDPKPLHGTIYYKLKQVDLDGAYTFSHIVKVHKTPSHTPSAYPNPALDFINISTNEYEGVQLRIFNQRGELMFIDTKPEAVSRIDLSGYAPGTYVYKLLDQENAVLSTNRFIKQ
jgi:hypothetical protein